MIDFPYSDIENPTVIMTVGVPGCGKTRFASELSRALHCAIVSPDELRETLLGDARNQQFNNLIWKAAKAMVAASIAAGRNVIVDAMYVEPEYRHQDAAYFRSMGAKKIIAVTFTTSLEICLSRNAQRARQVDPIAIEDLHRHLVDHPPILADGFDSILTISS